MRFRPRRSCWSFCAGKRPDRTADGGFRVELIKDIDSMRRVAATASAAGRSVGLVPTMGAFHRGHMELMRAAGRGSGVLVTSVFVNPLQFGPDEDYDRYPRQLERDAEVAAECGVDYLFCPGADDMYPGGKAGVLVKTGALGDVLCGAGRPGHFDGVATVVVKLLNIVTPDAAFFGRKDYQQLVIVRDVVRALEMNVDIRAIETVRDADGLALSSRNLYLTDEERAQAPNIYRALCRARDLIVAGERDAEVVRGQAREVVGSGKGVDVEYLAICDARTLGELTRVKGDVLIACAVKVGATRLIDNIRVSVG